MRIAVPATLVWAGLLSVAIAACGDDPAAGDPGAGGSGCEDGAGGVGPSRCPVGYVPIAGGGPGGEDVCETSQPPVCDPDHEGPRRLCVDCRADAEDTCRLDKPSGGYADNSPTGPRCDVPEGTVFHELRRTVGTDTCSIQVAPSCGESR